MYHAKTVFVGDEGVGKRSLLHCLVDGLAIGGDEYLPRFYNPQSVSLMDSTKTKVVDNTLWNSEGNGDYDTLRPLSYPQADLFICCFSMDSPYSLAHISDKYIPEIRGVSDKPILLVGTKADKRWPQGDYRTSDMTWRLSTEYHVRQMQINGDKKYHYNKPSKHNAFDLVSDAVLMKILCKTYTPDLLNVAMTCRRLNDAAHSIIVSGRAVPVNTAVKMKDIRDVVSKNPDCVVGYVLVSALDFGNIDTLLESMVELLLSRSNDTIPVRYTRLQRILHAVVPGKQRRYNRKREMAQLQLTRIAITY